MRSTAGKHSPGWISRRLRTPGRSLQNSEICVSRNSRRRMASGSGSIRRRASSYEWTSAFPTKAGDCSSSLATFFKRRNTMLPAFILMLMLGQKFYADDPILRDDDSKVEVTEITKYKLNDQYDFIQHSFGKPGDRSKARSANANTLGAAPDSSWFQSRHGMSPMSLSELVRGPNTVDGPSQEQPWAVIDAKTEGVTP